MIRSMRYLSRFIYAVFILALGGSSIFLWHCFLSKKQLHVVAYTPKKMLDATGRSEIRVSFDRPMVAADRVGKKMSSGPLLITPLLSGTYLWVDRQTLTFTPKAPVPLSRMYRIQLLPDLQAQDGSILKQPYEWAIHTQRLQVTELKTCINRKLTRFCSTECQHSSETEYWLNNCVEQYHALPTLPEFQLQFNQRVDPQLVAEKCFLKEKADGMVKLGLSSTKKQTVVTETVILRPVHPLAKEHSYQLFCEPSLHGDQGPLGMETSYSHWVHTAGELKVIGSTPKGATVSPGTVKVSVEFSNPIDFSSEVERHLVSQPDLRYLRYGNFLPRSIYCNEDYESESEEELPVSKPKKAKRKSQEDRFIYGLVLKNLQPRTFYQIRVKAGLRDIYGQTLKKDYWFSFATGDGPPTLALNSEENENSSVEDHVYIINGAQPYYTYWTRNINRLEAALYPATEEQVIPFTRGKLKDWQKQGFPSLTRSLPITSTLNVGQEGRIDFSALLSRKDPKGFFALGIRGEGISKFKRLIANLTDLGLLAKLGESNGLVWVIHLSTGKPASGATIRVRDQSNRLLFSGNTEKDGTLYLPGLRSLFKPVNTSLRIREEDYGYSKSDKVYITAQQNEDLTVVSGQWNRGLQAWNFKLPNDLERPTAIRGFIHTDRGLYRPREVVHIKGLARVVQGKDGLVLPQAKSIEVIILDPEEHEVLKRTLALSPFGSFAFDFTLGKMARLGDWSVKAQLVQEGERETFRDHFSVEEYRPATFEVKIRTPKAQLFLGEQGRVNLAANYLYGAAMNDGKVQFNVRRREHLPYFSQYPDFIFTDLATLENLGYYWVRYEDRFYSSLVMEAEQRLNRQGRASLHFSTAPSNEQIKTSQDFLVEATVTDKANQAVTRSLAITAHRSSFYLGLQTSDYVPLIHKPFHLKAIAVTPQGKLKATAAELEINRREWTCSPEGAGLYRVGNKKCTYKYTLLERRPVELAAKVNEITLTLTQPGEMQLKLKAKDEHGYEVIASDRVWTAGGAYASWRESNTVNIPLITNKSRYQPGEVAKFMAQTSITNGMALVTVERDGVLRHLVKPFSSSGIPFTVPLKDYDAPNVFASAVIVKPGKGNREPERPVFKMGMSYLAVDASHKDLKVQVSTDKPSYKPQEIIKVKVAIKNQRGLPVKSEVAIAVADEGVLQLIGYRTPHPQKAFYAPYGLGVCAATSFNRLAAAINYRIPVEEWERGIGCNDSTEGADGGGGPLDSNLRSKFLSTAFWAPQVLTDNRGQAEVTFSAPDNLTAFRVMAVAADNGYRFGADEVRLTVAKPLLAQPALPRFLNLGDQIQAGVVIHNNTKQNGMVDVAVTGRGLLIEGTDRTKILVAAGASQPAFFNFKAAQPPLAELRFNSTMDKESDAVLFKLPVQRPTRPETTVVGEGTASPHSPASMVVKRPAHALVDEGEMEVVLDRTGLASIDEGLRYLIRYPYGCLEQTTSQVIPLAMIDELAKSLDLPNLRGEQLREFIVAGVEKILRHQTPDGGFSLWLDSEPETFLTAFALYGLKRAQAAGYGADLPIKAAMTRGIRALRDRLTQTRKMGYSHFGESGSRAFALYVLAEMQKSEPGMMAKLYEQRTALPLYGKAFLARAMNRAQFKGSEVEQLLKEIEARQRSLPGRSDASIIDEPNQKDLYWHMSSNIRTTAISLAALLELKSNHWLIPKLVKGLLASRQQGRWDNTQDNLFSLVALADYARFQRQVQTREDVATVKLSGAPLYTARFDSGQPAIQRFHLLLRELKPGMLQITSRNNPINYSVRLHWARSMEKMEAEHQGISVARLILDSKTYQPKNSLRVGEVVNVVLKIISPKDRAYVALVDRLPAGLEPINPRLEPQNQAQEQQRHQYYWSALEMRDDRVQVFANELHAKKEMRFSYLARATSAGTFLYPAATVEEMYHPENNGHTASQYLVINPR